MSLNLDTIPVIVLKMFYGVSKQIRIHTKLLIQFIIRFQIHHILEVGSFNN